MNLKQYYRSILTEEIKKVTPREAALIRQQLGLPPRSTVERLGGSEQTLPMGAGWNTESQGVVDKAVTVFSQDDRELKRTVVKGQHRKLPPQEKNSNGLRNFLLHGTRPSPDEVGLSIDAISPPRIAKASKIRPVNPIDKQQKMQDDMRRVFQGLGIQHDEHPDSLPARVNLYNTVKHFQNIGVKLEPKHIEGIDFSNPDFKSHIDTVYSRVFGDGNFHW